MQKEKQFYPYTSIDEFSHFRYVEAFEKSSTYASAQFVLHMLKAFPFPVECVQTDNCFDFTKRFGNCKNNSNLTLFEKTLKNLGIEHRKIRPFTPKHNGKAERSHRKDNEYFYALHHFYLFDDFSTQLKVHNRKYHLFLCIP